jgi:hypothetical protein
MPLALTALQLLEFAMNKQLHTQLMALREPLALWE